MPRPRATTVGLVLLLAAVGYAAVSAPFGGSHDGGIWPVGLASGLLVHVGRRHRLSALALVAAVAAGTYGASGFPPAALPLLVAGIAAEALVVAGVLGSGRGGPRRLWDDADLARFLLACTAGALVGAAAFGLAGSLVDGLHPGPLVLATFVGHLVSQMTLLAFFLGRLDSPGPQSRAERSVRWLLTAAVGVVVLLPATPTALIFLVVPLVAWTTLRATMREALWHLVAIIALNDLLLRLGRSPFAGVRMFGSRFSELDVVPTQLFNLGCALLCIPFAMTVARHRRTAQQVVTERARFKRIVEGANRIAIVEFDVEGRITLFNPGAQELFGYGQAEVLGRTGAFLCSREEFARQARLRGVRDHPGDVAYAAARDGGARDWVYLRKDGTTRHVSMTMSELRDDQGLVVGLLSTAEDITDRVRTQQALVKALATERRAVAQLTEIDRTKDAFVSSVSHELRTPITSIVGYLELLLDGAYGETTKGQHEALRRIDTSSHRLLELIDDLLTLSNVESLDLELSKRPLDLRELVRHSLRSIGPELAERCHDLQLELPTEPVIVLGDGEHLERMMLSLVSNAVKFTPRGGTITLRVDHDGDRGLIEVEDTGVGFRESERALLFNRFWRSAYAQSEAVQGSGLGLAIARSIAQLHGARISASSTPGVGSVFSVSFEESGRHAALAAR